MLKVLEEEKQLEEGEDNAKKSGQKLWLDEGVVHATKFLSTFIKKEEFRELSEAEAKV